MDKQLFLDIYQAFEDKKQRFIDAGVTPIAMIDRFRGQPLNPEQFETYALPALFIEYTIQWDRVGQVYNGMVGFGFHLVTEPTWDMSSISTNKEAGLEYYTLVDCVREVLDNFRTGYISALLRTADEPIDAGVIMYHRLGYQGKYYPNGLVEPTYGDSKYGNDIKVIGNLTKKM